MTQAPIGPDRPSRHWRIAAALLLAIGSGSAAASAPDAPALDMEADRIAERIREAERLDDPQASAAALRAAADEADRLAARVDAESALWRRLQSDRLYALGVAADHAAAVRVYDTLRDAGHAIPAYAVPAAAHALIAVSRRREAEQLLVIAQFAEPA